MKLSQDEFQKLQTYWYERLKSDGFKDIERFENGQWITVDTEAQKFRYYNVDKELYFSLIGHIVNDEKTVFRNDTDKYILTRYSQGAHIKTIVKELIEQNRCRLRNTISRNTITMIIRRYEIAWKIRNG